MQDIIISLNIFYFIILYFLSLLLYIKIYYYQWNNGQLVAMGWSHQEELLCIQEDGQVLRYDMFGTYQHTFSMGEVNEIFVIKKIRLQLFFFTFLLIYYNY